MCVQNAYLEPMRISRWISVQSEQALVMFRITFWCYKACCYWRWELLGRVGVGHQVVRVMLVGMKLG